MLYLNMKFSSICNKRFVLLDQGGRHAIKVKGNLPEN